MIAIAVIHPTIRRPQHEKNNFSARVNFIILGLTLP
jgi:hypothetical protein